MNSCTLKRLFSYTLKIVKIPSIDSGIFMTEVSQGKGNLKFIAKIHKYNSKKDFFPFYIYKNVFNLFTHLIDFLRNICSCFEKNVIFFQH